MNNAGTEQTGSYMKRERDADFLANRNNLKIEKCEKPENKQMPKPLQESKEPNESKK